MAKKEQLEQNHDEVAAPAEESKPVTIMDMLREQQAINERINYQAAQVKGQTFVRGK
jgi:hypothetical protein